MLKRRLKYWCAYGPYLLARIPITLLHAMAWRIYDGEVKQGIRVADTNPETRQKFVRMVDEAVRLMAKGDRIRHARTQREIRMVLQMPTYSGAAYYRPGKTCVIDVRALLSEPEENATRVLAAVLVREATHGHLHSRKIMYTRSTKMKAEAICNRESRSYGRKIGLVLRELSEEEMRPPTLRERLAWRPWG